MGKIETSQTEAGEEALAGQKELASALKKKNLFVPKPAKPSAPTFTAILGSEAFSGSKWYKVGDRVNGAKVLKITATAVTVEWEGQEKKLVLVDTGGPGVSPDRTAVKHSGPVKSRKERGDIKSKKIKPAKAAAKGRG